uniref:Uncharacterized protein n=1 Tax=Oryza brachyantha TaxID=4533 RepID=J3KXY3_ORYBR
MIEHAKIKTNKHKRKTQLKNTHRKLPHCLLHCNCHRVNTPLISKQRTNGPPSPIVILSSLKYTTTTFCLFVQLFLLIFNMFDLKVVATFIQNNVSYSLKFLDVGFHIIIKETAFTYKCFSWTSLTPTVKLPETNETFIKNTVHLAR